MKKLTYLFLLLPYLIQSQVTVSGQKATYRNPYPTPIKVQVVNKPTTQQPSFAESYTKGLQAGAAVRAANAAAANASAARDMAQSEALKNNSQTIEIDKIKYTPNKYKYLAIRKIAGWMVTGNFRTIASEIINAQKYIMVNNELKIKKERKSDKRKRIKWEAKIDERKVFLPLIPSEYTNNPEVLYLEWSREALSQNDRFTRLILKNSEGETLYEATYKNKGYSEMLRPLLVDYRMNKTDVINKLMELKEYLDLGIITQEEFDKKAVALKKILLDN
jgi:hypothetical protein